MYSMTIQSAAIQILENLSHRDISIHKLYNSTGTRTRASSRYNKRDKDIETITGSNSADPSLMHAQREKNKR